MRLSYVIMLALSVGYASALPGTLSGTETRLVNNRNKMLDWKVMAPPKGKGDERLSARDTEVDKTTMTEGKGDDVDGGKDVKSKAGNDNDRGGEIMKDMVQMLNRLRNSTFVRSKMEKAKDVARDKWRMISSA